MSFVGGGCDGVRMTTNTAPLPFPAPAAAALLELAVGARFVADNAALHLNNVVHDAVRHGATWDHVGYWLNLSSDEARARFEHADAAIYLDDEAVLALARCADQLGMTNLDEVATLVIKAAIEKWQDETDGAPTPDGTDSA